MLSHLKPIWNLGYLLLPLIFQTVISAPVETQWTSWPRHQHRVFNESHLHPHTPITPDGYAADGLYHLTVLHTNDIHGHLAEFNRLGMDCLKEEIDGNLCYGGIARLKWVIDWARKHHPNLLLADAGDQFQGTLYFRTGGGTWIADMMNSFKYDVMTIGNHEFDEGEPYLARFIRSLKFPVVASNIDLNSPGAKNLAKVVIPYYVDEARQLGIIGYLTNNTGMLTPGATDIDFYDPVPIVQQHVNTLHARGIKRIICVSHSGYKQDIDLATRTFGIDLIVGGHSHSLLIKDEANPERVGTFPTPAKNLQNQTTWIVQAHRYGKYVGLVDLAWDRDNNLVSVEGDPILMDQTVDMDPTTAAKVSKWALTFASKKKEIIGTLAGPLDYIICKIQECVLGTILAEALLDYGREAVGVQIGLMNEGGIRSGMNGGLVSVADVETVSTIPNELVYFDYSGAQIAIMISDCLDYGVSRLTGRPITSFPHFAGLRYAYNASEPRYHKLKKVEVYVDGSWKRLEKDCIYRIGSPNFVAEGGDGFIPGLIQGESFFSMNGHPLISEVMKSWFLKKKFVGDTTDGRASKDPNVKWNDNVGIIPL